MEEKLYNPNAQTSSAGVTDEDWYQTADAIFKARMADYQSYGQPGGYASYVQEARQYKSNFDPLETMGYLNAQRAIDSNWEYARELGKSIYNGGVGVVRDTLNGIRAARDYNIALLNEQAKAQGFERNPQQEYIEALDNAAKAKVLQPYEIKQSASGIGQFGLDVAQGAGQLVGQMAGSVAMNAVLPGAGGVGLMMAQIAGGQYEDLKAKGVDTKRAAEAAFWNAFFQTPFEYMSLTRLMKRVPAGSVFKKKLKMVLEDMFTEGITEAIQQFPEEWAELWALNPDKSWKELQTLAAKKFPDTMQNALYAGLIGAVLGAGSRGIHIAIDRNINMALQKELHDERMTTLKDRVNSIKEAGISPDYAGETINANLNNATVMVDGEVLNAYAQRAGMEKTAEKLGVTVEDITEAARKGDTVEIKQGNFEALSASDQTFFQEVQDALSFDANDMSNLKYNAIQANIQRYSDLAEEQKKELKAEVDKIGETVIKSGQTKTVAELWKALYLRAALRARPDNPAQWVRDNPLRFEKGFAPEVKPGLNFSNNQSDLHLVKDILTTNYENPRAEVENRLKQVEEQIRQIESKEREAATDNELATLNNQRNLLRSLLNDVESGEGVAGVPAIDDYKNIYDQEKGTFNVPKPGQYKQTTEVSPDGSVVVSPGVVELNAASARDEDTQNYLREVMAQKGLTKDEQDGVLAWIELYVSIAEELLKKHPSMKEWHEKGFKRFTLENGIQLPAVSAFKNNGEYVYNIDLGTLCTKREALDAVIQILVDKGMSQKIGPTQYTALSDMLAELGFLTHCKICFVEGKRVRVLMDANKFSFEWRSVLRALGIEDDNVVGDKRQFTPEQMARLEAMTDETPVPVIDPKTGQQKMKKVKDKKTGEEKLVPETEKAFKLAYRKFMPMYARRQTGDAGITPDKMLKIAKLFKEDPSLAGIFKPEWLQTSRGTSWLMDKFGETSIRGVLASMYGAATSKPLEYFDVYDPISWGVIFDRKNGAEGLMKKLYDIGGVRAQSFTDFNPMLFVDYVQMVADLAVRGLPMHVYTKVPSFVKLFGETGMMINMSLVARVDPNTDAEHAGLVWNPKTQEWDYAWADESFPVEEAFALRENPKYGGRVGTIAVALSDAHMEKLLADPRIDQVIPFHKSGMSEEVLAMTGLNRAKNFTFDQTEKNVPNGMSVISYNALLQEHRDPRKAADAYLEWCDKNGVTPTFKDYIKNPNYYKLQEDFRGYDNDGNPVIQGAVRMQLPENAKEILDEAWAERGAYMEKLAELKNSQQFLEKAMKRLEPQHIDGEVRKELMRRLRNIMGSKNVISLQQGDFLDALENSEAQTMGKEAAKNRVEVFRNGQGIVYGFTHNGKIYLNENTFNANTPAHEFTHIWVQVARKVNPKLWNHGKSMLKDTYEWVQVTHDPLYANIRGDEEAIASEVLARIVGRENEAFVRDFMDKGQLEKQIRTEYADDPKEMNRLLKFVKYGTGKTLRKQIMDWFKELWEGVRSLFDPVKKGQYPTYDEFIHMPLKDLWDSTAEGTKTSTTDYSKRFTKALNEIYKNGGIEDMPASEYEDRGVPGGAGQVAASAIEMQAGQTYSQMAGESAVNAPLADLQRAKQMEADGVDRMKIWDDTGWIKGKDGRWRFEIKDSLDEVDLSVLADTNFGRKLSDVYNNKLLYEAYPQLADIIVVPDATLKGNEWGYFDPTDNTIHVQQKLLTSDVQTAKETLVHEIQHLIQRIEGFAGGGNPEAIKTWLLKEGIRLTREIQAVHPDALKYLKLGNAKELSESSLTEEQKEKIDDLKKKRDKVEADLRLVESNPFAAYQNLAGEQEARETVLRAKARTSSQQVLKEVAEDEKNALEKLNSEVAKLSDEDKQTYEQYVQLARETDTNKMPDDYFERLAELESKIPSDVLDAYNDYADAAWLKEDSMKTVYGRGVMPRVHENNAIVISAEAMENASAGGYKQGQTSQIKGSFDPFTGEDGVAVIKLFEGADASTVIHETGHYFVEAMWREIAAGRATEQQKADFEKLMQYCGITTAQWAKLDTEGRRAAHERLAEAFETYIMEDKAPTRELRPVFKRFAEWLKSIYAAISRNKNAVPLTDEVREVFDRMLASEEDVEELKRVEGYFEKLPGVITDNLSDATKKRIEDYILKAQDKAVEILTKERLANFTEERKKEIENFRNSISDEVRQRIANRPLYVASRQVQEIFGGEKPASAKVYANQYLEEKLSDENEVKWEIVAEQNGMTPSELASKIVNEPSENEAYNAAMDAAVQKEYPDYYTERAQAEEATKQAMYNDESGILLGVEQVLITDFANRAYGRQVVQETKNKIKKEEREKAKAQQPKVEMPKRSAEETRKLAMAKRQQAKVAAQKELANMKLKDATNVNKFMRAERNCAVKSAEAMAKKDYETARHYKDMQAFNHACVIEAANLAKRKQQYDKFLRRLARSTPKNWFSEQHWNQAMALFARMGIPNGKYDPTTRTQSLTDYLAEMGDWYYAFGEAPGWLLDETWQINDPMNMTFEDYESVVDLLEYIKTMDKAEKADDFFDSQMKYNEWKAQAIENLNKLATKFTPILGERQTATLKETFDSAYQTLDNFLEKIDGWHYGFFSKCFGESIKHCNDNEYIKNEAFDKRTAEAEAAWCPTEEALAEKAKGVYYEELGATANKFVLTKLLMNLGNEGNARKLCSTYPSEDLRGSPLWVFPSAYMTKDEAIEQTKENLLEFLGRVLTKEDIAYAQAKVDAQGMFWGEMSDMERRTKGFTPKKVEAYPVTLTLANGEQVVFRGGYFPLMRNGEMGSHPAGILPVSDTDPNQGKNVRTMHTDTGHMMARVDADYPVDLTEGSEIRAMRAAIHDLCWRETMTEFRRILNDPVMFGLMKSKFGIADMSAFRKMLEVAAQPNSGFSMEMAENMMAQTAGWLRRKTVAAIVMMNFRVNFQNFGNLFLYGNTVEGFGYTDVLSAMSSAFSNGFDGKSFMEMWAFVDEKSAFMRERSTTPDITLAQLRDEGKMNKFERRVAEWGARMMMYTDGATARPVWCQAYYKKINAGATEQEAIDFADTVVRRTLGSGRATDVASIQRGTPTFRLFTAFQGFFNTQFNQWVREYNVDKRLLEEGEYRDAALRITSFVASKYILACMANIALTLQNPFDDDDDDEYKNITEEIIHYPMSLVGIIGPMVNNFVIDPTLGMKAYSYRMSIIENSLDKIKRTSKNLHNVIDGDFAPALESLTDIAGIAYGVPAQLNRLFWNAYDIFVNGMDPRLEDLTTRRPKRERK